MVLVTVRIRNRLSHQPGADGYVNGEQSYSTFLCPKHEQQLWDLGAVWKFSDKSQVGNCTQQAQGNLHKEHREKVKEPRPARLARWDDSILAQTCFSRGHRPACHLDPHLSPSPTTRGHRVLCSLHFVHPHCWSRHLRLSLHDTVAA